MSSALFVSLVLLAVLAALVSGRLEPKAVFPGALLLFVLTGQIEMEDVLGHFTNPALVSLVLLLVLSPVLEKTLFVEWVGQRILGLKYQGTLSRLGLFTALLSAFLSNTAVVASLMGRINVSKQFLPSKLLIPLSYAAILGGTVTLVGTSTNLIVNSFVLGAGLPSLGFFDFLPVGVAATAVGLLVMVVLGDRVLPEYPRGERSSREYFLETQVERGSPLVGRTIEENQLRALRTLFLVEIYRDNQLISPVAPTEVIRAEDILLFTGDVGEVEQLEQIPGLRFVSDMRPIEQTRLVEVIVSGFSSLAGKTVREAEFRAKFNAAVVAIARGDQRLSGKIGDLRMHTGDALLLAVGDDFDTLSHGDHNFHLVNGQVKRERLNGWRSVAVVASFFGGLAAVAAGWVPLLDLLVFLLAAYLACGFTHLKELRGRFPFALMAIIGSALALSQVMVDSGVTAAIAEAIVALVDGNGVWFGFFAIYLMTVLLTEFITNNVAASVAFPIAFGFAEGFGVSPMPFIMAVAYGASASFVTPYGYQTNLMVYSAGRYRFTDFVRLGLPLSLVYSLVVLVLIPLVFPF
ncbi:MAG: SLC13 family permease [Pseudomonadota bacterium]|nr:SLC13 family permease [Pseudomonadota bacterium]